MSKVHQIKTEVKAIQALPGMMFIDLATVMQRTGFSRSFIYGNISENLFPRPVKCGPKASRWVLSEIEHWMASRIACRDAGMQPKAAMQAIQ